MNPLLAALEEACAAQLLACLLEVLRVSESSAVPPEVAAICERVVSSCGAVAAIGMDGFLAM